MAEWIEKFIIKNKFSRPGEKNNGIKGIVMHWTATPGASDDNEVKFFDGADGGGGRYASAHLFVDRDSATLDIPLNEVAYHANDHACRVAQLKPNANYTSIGIEMCVEKDGTIHPETVARAAKVAAALCKQFGLEPLKDIFRHFDVTGKNCPAPWVSNGALFEKFKKDVNAIVHPPVAPKPAAPAKVYRVRKTWEDVASQIGAFEDPKSAKELADKNPGFKVFSPDGKVVVFKEGPAPAPAAPKPAPKPVAPAPKPQPTATVPYPGRPVKYGSVGKDVERVQRAVGASPVDGQFGPGTEAKVKAYQKRMGLTPDGIVGPGTWNVMF